MLTQEQGGLLVKLAKEAVKGKVNMPNDSFLKEKRGLFVTLTIKGELRGCIGFPYPTTQLGKAVVEAARSAAFKDPRFSPLTEEEFELLDFEVSVLSKPIKCRLKSIKEGDGVILEAKGRSALFLPQVWEDLPDKKLFLEQLSLKAYLPRDAYKTADYQKFSVQVFK